MMHTPVAPFRGITLLIAVILSSVVLSVALALLDISYKQILLASSAKQSQYAFYNADSAMECALYWDQQKDAFDYTLTPYLDPAQGHISCTDLNGIQHDIYPSLAPNSSPPPAGFIRTTTFAIPCTGGTSGVITVAKSNKGGARIYVTGYSTCVATDPRRIERGLTVTYGDTVGGP
ncbi:MAG: seg [Parcubacteria group bacterium]|nr:seg [Parcubacteria group bacterium]